MQKIEAQFEIVTPMFIGGGDHQESPEIRPPSIKGALRFWWRALHWGNCLKESANTDAALQLLHKREAELFGAAFRDNQYGQGLCTLKLKDVMTKGVEENWPISNNNSGSGYLGYGLDKTKNGAPHRKGVTKGQFTLCLILKKGIGNIQTEQLNNAVLLWGLLGGLGSRSRRGFGSIAIKNLNGESFDFSSQNDYENAVHALFNKLSLAPEMPIFTALNDAMMIADAGQGNDARRLMDKLGAQYKEARKEAGAGFAKLPFGLPLAGNRGASDEENRRSGPLFMHIHPIGNQFIAIVSFIPADFHPEHPKGKQLDFYKTIQDYIGTMERVYP